ncbi:MAG: FliM/FliN family flagellar motor switch protein [Ottowia sp.]|nr:FliM/FliN family flagellar motor switch protein [Ottowia sp.]
MQIPYLTEAAFALLQKVGTGHCLENDQGILSIHFSSLGGPGISITGMLNDQPISFWMDETQWCDWIRPVLSLPSLDKAPQELRMALAQRTVASLSDWLGDDYIALPQAQLFVSAAVNREPDWVITLEQSTRRLSLRVLDAPSSWLFGLADALTTPTNQPSEERYLMVLAAGQTSLSLTALNNLRVGDAVVLKQAGHIDAGEVWLLRGEQRYVLQQEEDQQYRVEQVVDATDFSASQNGGDRVTLLAQIGQVNFDLNALSYLSVGESLEIPTHFYEHVNLMNKNQCVAKGHLMKVGDEWVVRVDQLMG